MKATPIYIQQLEVENIKTFEARTVLLLTRPEGDISQWTLLLGDNGVGKSTLLQLIAWMKPVLPYDVNDIPEDFIPAPLINDEENEVLERLVHKAVKRQRKATIYAKFVANQPLGQPLREPLSICETTMAIELNSAGKLHDVAKGFDTEKESVFYRDEVAVYAYSASRQLGRLNLNNPKLLDTIPGFIQEKTELYDAVEILHALNYYAALGAKSDDEKKKYTDFIESVKAMLTSLLPDCERIEDIIITPPNPLGGSTEGGVSITTRHGDKIPFDDFSLGYKTVTSWTIDLAWRLFSKHHHKPGNPLHESAIVLIDEIDLHLHPLWQRDIMANLAQHFPNIQFIASAHSPLMVQAAVHSNYAVLKVTDAGVAIENEPAGIDGWRVDQILTSELFGLESARGAAYDKLMARRKKLVALTKRSAAQEAELERITLELSELPSGETPAEMNDRQLLANLVAKLSPAK